MNTPEWADVASYLLGMRHAVCLLALLAATAHAQPDDWGTLDLSVGGTAPLATGYEPDWTSRPGGAIRVGLPAYGGLVRAAIEASRHAPTDPALPAFGTVSATLGWGPDLTLGRMRLAAGAEVGAVLFRFERTDAEGFQNVTETEAAVGVWARLGLPVTGRVRAWVEADALRIALSDPTLVATASAGLGVRLDTPRWLREVLR